MEVLFVRRRLPALIPHQLSVTNVFEKNCGKYQSRGLILGKLVGQMCFFRLHHFAAECRRNLVCTQKRNVSTYQKSFSSTRVVYGSQLWFIAKLFLRSFNRFGALISVFVDSYHLACSVLWPKCPKNLFLVEYTLLQHLLNTLFCSVTIIVFFELKLFSVEKLGLNDRNSLTCNVFFEFFSGVFLTCFSEWFFWIDAILCIYQVTASKQFRVNNWTDSQLLGFVGD